MEGIINWIVELNKTNQIGFAVLTVVTMVVVGCSIAIVVELAFKALGIKVEKIKHQH